MINFSRFFAFMIGYVLIIQMDFGVIQVNAFIDYLNSFSALISEEELIIE